MPPPARLAGVVRGLEGAHADIERHAAAPFRVQREGGDAGSGAAREGFDPVVSAPDLCDRALYELEQADESAHKDG